MSAADQAFRHQSALGITDVVLRDAHQSLLATRMRLEDMLPVADKLDRVGFWSVESWGGATFDACIRYLGEDPWERIRQLKAAMPNTPQQMLFRAQNILGYRHYADDVVEAFVERAAVNGVDVFRIFDAMNDPRNLETAIAAVKKTGKHAQGTISYTVSPVHTLETWLQLSEQIEAMGADSLCIKDMAGLLKPYVAHDLVSQLKQRLSIPIHMQSHATTGMSTATALKAIEAGIDNVDTAISSMSMTYGHSPTESLVAILQDTPRNTGLDLNLLEDIAAYFREVRKKYHRFEGSLRGVDSRILVAQVPGGMLTNMENQLREQGAADRLDEVLEEIPKVRKELGYIPLVTPTSQIVGTQAVLNVLTGERYKSISKETAAVLKGEYGATPAPVDEELQAKVLEGGEPVTCRPADLLQPELESLRQELCELSEKEGFELEDGDRQTDDVLTYALFPQVGLRFLKNRDNPDAFEPAPQDEVEAAPSDKAATSQAAVEASGTASDTAAYQVEVDGQLFKVRVSDSGDMDARPAAERGGASAQSNTSAQSSAGATTTIDAPLAGNVFKLTVSEGQSVSAGDVVMILEAMKMETEVRAVSDGKIAAIAVKNGDSVSVGDTLMSLEN